MCARITVCLSMCVLVGLVGTVRGGEPAVPVTVREPAGVDRTAEPVTGGIPFTIGQVKSVGDLALYDHSGRPVPAQFSRLAGYEDGSLQWALVDFLTDVPAGGTAEFVVKKGRAAVPAKPLTISETGEVVTVDTGAAMFTINKAAFSLLDTVELAGARVAGPGSVGLIDGEGKAFRAGRPSRLSWEYKGPVRATLRVDGAYLDDTGTAFLSYTARLTFWAGSAVVRVNHSLRNSHPEQGFDAKIKQATLSVKLAFDAADRGRGPHWTAGGDGRVGLLLAVRHAGGCFPGGSTYRHAPSKTLYRQSVAGRKAEVFTVPPVDTPPVVAQGAWYGYDPTEGVFALGDCAHKDTEIWLDFYQGKRPAAVNDARQRALRGWLHAVADPKWISETETLGVGHFGALKDEIATYRKWGWKGWDDKKKYPRMPHAPGAYVAKELIHNESEADSTECYLLMYVRTGERGFLDWGRAWAEYHKTHYAYRTDGFIYRKARPTKGLQVGWYGPRKYGWNDSRSEYCHFYGRGIFDYYCLTGDVDALEGGRDLVEEVADWTARYKPGSSIGHYGCRGFARVWLGALRLAQLTREKKDRELADRLAEVTFKASDWDPRGFVYWGAGPGHMATHALKPSSWPPRFKAYMERTGTTLSTRGIVTAKDGTSWPLRSDGGTWQQVTLGMALERYWRLTGRPEAKAFAVKMAEFARDYQWSKKCHQMYYYTMLDFPEKDRVYDPGEWDDAHRNCPGPGAKHSGHYTRFFPDVFARAYAMTGDSAWLEWAKRVWNRGSKRGYMQTRQSAADDEVSIFAYHHAPKDDSILSTARMFYEVPRAR